MTSRLAWIEELLVVQKIITLWQVYVARGIYRQRSIVHAIKIGAAFIVDRGDDKWWFILIGLVMCEAISYLMDDARNDGRINRAVDDRCDDGAINRDIRDWHLIRFIHVIVQCKWNRLVISILRKSVVSDLDLEGEGYHMPSMGTSWGVGCDAWRPCHAGRRNRPWSTRTLCCVG